MLIVALRAIPFLRVCCTAVFLITVMARAMQAQTSVSIDLPDAVRRAQVYNAQFLAGRTGVSLADEARTQARALLLPAASLLSQYAYTEHNGTDSGIFIANNGVHEFAQQALVHAEPYSLAKRAEYRRSIAGSPRATA